jgi:hypothetical protein
MKTYLLFALIDVLLVILYLLAYLRSTFVRLFNRNKN